MADEKRKDYKGMRVKTEIVERLNKLIDNKSPQIEKLKPFGFTSPNGIVNTILDIITRKPELIDIIVQNYLSGK